MMDRCTDFALKPESRSMPAFSNERDGIESPLIRLMPPHDEVHHQADKSPEQNDHQLNGNVDPDQNRVKAQHDEDRQVFIEVLDSNRMSRRQQHMPAMLQQRIHWHDEE